MSDLPGIIFFRIQLLPRSETFIASQAASMKKFKPFFVGWLRMAGHPLPEGQSWVVNKQSWVANTGGLLGKLRELRFRYLGPSRAQLGMLRALSAKLVYAHFALDSYAALRLAKKLKLPLVTALHGYDVTMSDEALGRTRLGREYLKGVEKLRQYSTLYIAGSEYLRQCGIERGFPADRIVAHHIGVDVTKFEPPAVENREPVVLFVGRLVEKKGCGVLIEAMVEVQRRLAEVELVIIGDGPLRQEYEAKAKALGVRCRFLGAQKPDVVKQWLSRAKVFCAPSVIAQSGDAEGFGIVFIEAQAMELPVVSTRSGGIVEAVADGETGILVPERDAPALSAAIVRLFEDEELWKRFSIAGRKRVLESFDVRKRTARLETIFEELLAKQKS